MARAPIKRRRGAAPSAASVQAATQMGARGPSAASVANQTQMGAIGPNAASIAAETQMENMRRGGRAGKSKPRKR